MRNDRSIKIKEHRVFLCELDLKIKNYGVFVCAMQPVILGPTCFDRERKKMFFGQVLEKAKVIWAGNSAENIG